MSKRGQISLAILVGLVLVIAVFLFWPSKREVETKVGEAYSQVIPIKNYMDICLKRSSEIAVWEFGLVGGNKDKGIPVYPDEALSISEMDADFSAPAAFCCKTVSTS